ncbi:hypothetical protein AOLI_G00163140 [Acnodon oligacanthus]
MSWVTLNIVLICGTLLSLSSFSPNSHHAPSYLLIKTDPTCWKYTTHPVLINRHLCSCHNGLPVYVDLDLPLTLISCILLVAILSSHSFISVVSSQS